MIREALEELMRITGMVRLGRKPTKDFELNGQLVRAGEFMVLSVPAAAHDQQAFPDAERVEVRRAPNAPMASVAGPIGAGACTRLASSP